MKCLGLLLILVGTALAQFSTMDQIPTVRQSNQVNGDTLAFGSNVVSGNLLIAQYSGDGTFTPTIADTLTSTWTLRVNNLNNGTDSAYLWTAPAASSGADTVTITESGASVQIFSVVEYANAAGFDAVGTASALTGASGVVSMPSVTTTKYRDAIVDIVIANNNVSVTPPIDVAYTAAYIAEDITTTSKTAYLQSRLSGDPGAIAGSSLSTSSASGQRSLQMALALTSTAALTISTPNIPNAVVSQTYSFQLQATGGAGTNVWSINSGLLPCGLSLSSGGVISGTPTCSNGNTITFKVTDTAAATATAALTLQVGTSANTVTRVQGASGLTLTGVTSGNTLIVGIAYTVAFASVYAETPILTDSLGTVFTVIPGATGDLSVLYWGIAPSSGNDTVVVSPAITSGLEWVSEWSNFQPIFDTGVVSKYASSTGASPVSSAAITSPVAGTLYAFAMPGTQTATVTVQSPFLRDINVSGGSSPRQMESDYAIGQTAGSNTASWTDTGNTSNTLTMALLGFRPTTTGTAPVAVAKHGRSQIY